MYRYIVDFRETPDPTWDHALPAIWSMIEICVATICACVPAIRALLAQALPLLFDTSTGGATEKQHSDQIQLNINPISPIWNKSASRYNELYDGRFSQEFELTDKGENGLPAFHRTAPLMPVQTEEVPHTPRKMEKIWAAQHEFHDNRAARDI